MTDERQSESLGEQSAQSAGQSQAKDGKEQEWDGKSRGGNFGTWFFVMLIRYAGIRAAYIFLAFVVPYFVLFAPKSTRSTWQFCRRVRGLGLFASVKEVFATYYTFGQCLIDKIAIAQGQQGLFEFVFDDEQAILDLLESGESAVVMSAHIGSWEAGAPFFSRFGKIMNVAVFDNEHERIKKIVEKQSNGKSFKIIALGSDWLGSVFSIKDALDRGEFVCFMGDRYMAGSPSNVVRFMGHDVRFPKGPFDVSAAMHSPVAFYFALREPGRRYHFYFACVRPEGSRRESSAAIQQAYVTMLEQIVTKYPRQWFNFYDFFNFKNK